MTLEVLEPNPVWVAEAYDDTVDVLAAHGDDVTFKVWCGDWCKDCRSLLPDFGAALEAADVPDENVEEFPLDEDKQGPGVEEYGIERIPTVIVEDSGREVARFVEDEGVPIAVYLAEEIETALGDETVADDGA